MALGLWEFKSPSGQTNFIYYNNYREKLSDSVGLHKYKLNVANISANISTTTCFYQHLNRFFDESEVFSDAHVTILRVLFHS